MSPLGCATLWIGPALGAVERACLRSVVRQGHPLALYCYREPAGVPEGVEVRDAAEILPESAVIRHRRSGSPSLFSNRFRYELQRQGGGVWLDADQYLIAPLPDDRPYLFAHYDRAGTGLGTGVLRLPPGSPMIADLLEPFEERTIPAWLPRRSRAAAWWRLRRTGRTGLAHMPWGVAGPAALTAVAARHGADRWALPADVLFPVHWDDAGWILDPAVALEDVLTARSIGVHLYNQVIREFKDRPAAPGSFLARLQAEGA